MKLYELSRIQVMANDHEAGKLGLKLLEIDSL